MFTLQVISTGTKFAKDATCKHRREQKFCTRCAVVQNYFSKEYYYFNILRPSHIRAVLTRSKRKANVHQKAFHIIEHAKL